jgi:hypothetical protein
MKHLDAERHQGATISPEDPSGNWWNRGVRAHNESNPVTRTEGDYRLTSFSIFSE